MEILSRARLKAERGTGLGAGCLFYCPKTGRYLLVKRSETCDEPNTWACLGGGIEVGETIEEGLLRECKEEGGFTGEVDLQPMYVSEQPNFTYHNFVGTVDEEFEPVLNHEHTEYQWAKPDSFPQPLHPKFAEALEHLKNPTEEMVEALAKQPYDYNRRLAKDTWHEFEDYAKGINDDPSTVVQVMGTEVDSCGTLIQPLIQVKSMKINSATRLLASKEQKLADSLRRFQPNYDAYKEVVYFEDVDSYDVEDIVNELDKLGFGVRVDTSKKYFKAKGKQNLTVERDGDYLELYFK